jgi:hypothetical protein
LTISFRPLRATAELVRYFDRLMDRPMPGPHPVLTLEPTETVVELESAPLPARVWTGTTADGVPVYALIALVAVDAAQECQELEGALIEQDGARFAPVAETLRRRAVLDAGRLEELYRHALEAHPHRLEAAAADRCPTCALLFGMREMLHALGRPVPA